MTVEFEPSRDPPGLEGRATAKVDAKTGVEMEALVAVSVACLTIYDMCKAVDRAMSFSDIRLGKRPAADPARFAAEELMALLSVAEALARVTEGLTPLETERVALDRATGRVLAEDLAAKLTQPPFDASAMDGYAVRAEDVAALPAS